MPDKETVNEPSTKPNRNGQPPSPGDGFGIPDAEEEWEVEPAPGEECRPNFCMNGAYCTIVSVVKRMGVVTGISDIACTCRNGYGGKLCDLGRFFVSISDVL